MPPAGTIQKTVEADGFVLVSATASKSEPCSASFPGNRGQPIWRAVSRKPIAAGLTLNREARAPTSVVVVAARLIIVAGMSRFATDLLLTGRL